MYLNEFDISVLSLYNQRIKRLSSFAKATADREWSHDPQFEKSKRCESKYSTE